VRTTRRGGERGRPWPVEVRLYVAVAGLAALAVLVVLLVGGVRAG